jgi:hypothetical protein
MSRRSRFRQDARAQHLWAAVGGSSRSRPRSSLSIITPPPRTVAAPRYPGSSGLDQAADRAASWRRLTGQSLDWSLFAARRFLTRGASASVCETQRLAFSDEVSSSRGDRRTCRQGRPIRAAADRPVLSGLSTAIVHPPFSEVCFERIAASWATSAHGTDAMWAMYADDAGDGLLHLDGPAEQGVLRKTHGLLERARGGARQELRSAPPVAFEFQSGGFTYALAGAAAFVEVPTLETTAKVIHFELLLDDYHAMLKHACAPSPSERVLSFAAIFIASFAGIAFFGRDGRVFLAGMGVGILGLFVRLLRTQHRLRPQRDGAWLCGYDVQLTQSGARVQTPNWTCDVPWRGILNGVSQKFKRGDSFLRSRPNGYSSRYFSDAMGS